MIRVGLRGVLIPDTEAGVGGQGWLNLDGRVAVEVDLDFRGFNAETGNFKIGRQAGVQLASERQSMGV